MEKENSNKKKIRMFLMILAVAILLSTVGFVFAKYVIIGDKNWGQVNAVNFYFTADLLGDTRMYRNDGSSENSYKFAPESTEETWSLYGGKAEVLTININNFYDELRITELQTVYTVAVSSTMNSALTNQISLSASSGVLAGKAAHTNTIVVTIPEYSPSFNYVDGDMVTITISSTKPYVKTLKLNFKLYSVDTQLHYQIIDNKQSPFAELVIMTGVVETNGEPTTVQPYIKWPNELYIDNTNELTFSMVSGTIVQQPGITDRDMQISKELATGRSESIFFFKSDINKDFTKSDTIVTKDGNGDYVIDFSTFTGTY